MIVNNKTLLMYSPIKEMKTKKVKENGVSYGLSEAGYDIRIKQEIVFDNRQGKQLVFCDGAVSEGSFTLASAIEEFQMPTNLVGIVHDKSTWARQALSVFNTVIEPGWKGFLTLELAYKGNGILKIPAGSGIAQVVFHLTSDEAQYEGKYQNQTDNPQVAKFE